ncbi:gluconolaconase [Pedobacter chinensis]|uniref:Gluconolaconase n=1 Tax=Pedobacter chinensis TaxID=2282421 RepID=A0A369Q0F6_9SPHI|nr:SMP-30/gluconolactonase/LRE family protein [Pedobacter chinensis]RDC57970.1 gluconolaconase [Pedobacter chinensis]
MKKLIYTIAAMAIAFSLKAQTPRITFKVPLLYPEGIAYDNQTRNFFVSSVKTGTIGKVDQSGNYTEFYQDKDLISSFGMKVDANGSKLFVCLSDPNANYSIYSTPKTFKKMARVIAIDLKKGKKVMDVDLSKVYKGDHFINDLTMDVVGNLFLTDSFSPVIYKVDASGKASVFAENEMFGSEDIGLNGIAFNPAGYLIAVNNSNGSILKIDVKDPKKVTRVKIDALFPGADGLLIDQGDLILVQNKSVNRVYRISSSDNWQTAKIKAATAGEDRFQQPSTAIMNNGQVWVLNSKLNELSNPTLVPSKEFSVQQAIFKPVN